jgi:hexosaminidase
VTRGLTFATILATLTAVSAASSPATAPTSAAPAFANTLMPQPSQLSVQEGRLAITPSFTAGTDRFRDARLDDAIGRSLDRIRTQTATSVSTAVAAGKATATLVVSIEGPGDAVQTVDEDESYSLDVTPFGARLRAATVVGAIHGLETLQQLIQSDMNSYFVPVVSIRDTPRFRWRGLMIDCARHFIPVDVLKHTLDGMAAVKLNVFHWHLSEDQGFRIESKAFPKLAGLGSDGLFYTQDQAREIVAYARDRGIRVVPEFDMPGHTGAWFVGYPDLASRHCQFEFVSEFCVLYRVFVN